MLCCLVAVILELSCGAVVVLLCVLFRFNVPLFLGLLGSSDCPLWYCCDVVLLCCCLVMFRCHVVLLLWCSVDVVVLL